MSRTVFGTCQRHISFIHHTVLTSQKRSVFSDLCSGDLTSNSKKHLFNLSLYLHCRWCSRVIYKYKKSDVNSEMGKKGGKRKGGQENKEGNGRTEHRGNYRSFPQGKVPHTINLVVIGTGGSGTSRSLLVTTDSSRYMFNCGEGTQRLSAMSKALRSSAYAKLAGLENIFITHKSWDNVGGLLGMAMTLEGQKNPDAKIYRNVERTPLSQQALPFIRLYGPPGVDKMTLMAKKFSVNSNMHIAHAKGEFKDHALTITPVTFHKEPSAETESDAGDSEPCGPAPKRQRRNSSSSQRPTSSVAYAYICKAKPPVPKINVEKCFDAGVTMGPMVGQLQKGNSVVLEDGTVVHPHQVTDVAPTDNRPFLIVECPSMDFMSSLKACPQLSEPVISEPQTSMAIVVHMTPAPVFNSVEYQSWMNRFHKSTDHIVINRDATDAELLRVREHQARLNLVSEEIFPLIPDLGSGGGTVNKLSSSVEENQKKQDSHEATTGETRSKGEEEKFGVDKIGGIMKACSGLVYVYRGKQVGFFVEEEKFDKDALQESYFEIPEVATELDRLKELQKPMSLNSDEDEASVKYPKLVFLGTGSSEPNRIRGQSCILAQLSKHTIVILDCGEDSYGQLHRFFGADKASRVLRKVKAIFVSHMHADHHLGLFSLLKERKNAFEKKGMPFVPAFLMAPIQMRRWLRFYHEELEPVTHLFRFVKHQKDMVDTDELALDVATENDVLNSLNLVEYKLVEVIHCRNAYGITWTHSNGFKMVYSGDTRPCENLVTAGKDCDMLIHEATHEDALQGHAEASNHSTFSEAMDIGERMNAKHIILTHFSQRYAHMVPFYDQTLPHNVSIAFDNMKVCPQVMDQLPKMIPALTSLFADELQKLNIKNIKRSREKRDEKESVASNS